MELSYGLLSVFHTHAMGLRQKGSEKEAFSYLNRCFTVIRDSGILQGVPNTQDEVRRYAMACEVMLEYAATCTQHAFRTEDGSWHETAVDIEKGIVELAGTLIPSLKDSGLDIDPIYREIHRAGNSLGVSFQRPKSLFAGRDTEAAVNYTSNAARYFREKAVGIIRAAGPNLRGQDRTDVLNAIRYCGNYATALYQRAEDYLSENASLEAVACYEKSLKVRAQIEKELIKPVFGVSSLKFCQSLTQRAGTIQAMARVGAEDLNAARELYGQAVRELCALEREAGGATSDGGSVTYQNARLGAQYGLAWCLYNSGDYDEALELHQQVFNERRELLGGDHVDTRKSLRAVEIVRAQILKRRSG